MNKYRGEVSVSLGGRDYIMRPTFEALIEIEDRLGIGIVAVARRFMTREFGVRDVACVISSGIKGGGQKVPDNLGEILAITGVLAFGDAISKFLAGALSGEIEEGNAEASSRQNIQSLGDASKKLA